MSLRPVPHDPWRFDCGECSIPFVTKRFWKWCKGRCGWKWRYRDGSRPWACNPWHGRGRVRSIYIYIIFKHIETIRYTQRSLFFLYFFFSFSLSCSDAATGFRVTWAVREDHAGNAFFDERASHFLLPDLASSPDAPFVQQQAKAAMLGAKGSWPLYIYIY